LTCLGSTFAGRVAASLLQAVGLPELIAHSLEEYEALARKIARDTDVARGIAKKLEARASSRLFDTAGSTRNLEAAYEAMRERVARGEPPADFAVADRIP
jgi:predicted O-linked N-acetylglucosamine transferase (SPINDLY family)